MDRTVRGPDFTGAQSLGNGITYLHFFLGTRHLSSLYCGCVITAVSPSKLVGFITPILQVRKSRSLRG